MTSGGGASAAEWSSVVEYRVEDGALVREQDGVVERVGPGVIALRVELTDAGTLTITTVAQTRAAGSEGTALAALQVDVHPRN